MYDTFGFACYCRRESGFLQKGGLACAAYSCEGDMRLKELLIDFGGSSFLYKDQSAIVSSVLKV